MMRLTALLLLCLPSTGLAAPAPQTTIHHCVGASGTPVFTDQPCASMDAVPATSRTDPLAPGPPTGPRTCPRDRGQLEQRVAAAFRARDANALAGLMLWRGYGERGAVRTVRDLADLMQWPFLGFAGAAPATPSPAMAGLPPLLPAAPATIAGPPSPGMLTIRLGRPEQPEVSFAVRSRAGCLWLEP